MRVLGVGVDIVEPCGFVLDDRRLGRAGLDYAALADVARHASWERFAKDCRESRLVLLSTKGTISHTEFDFAHDDRLIVGRDSSGVTPVVEVVIRIPMVQGARSLNVVTAAALVLGGVLQQTEAWPAITANHKNKELSTSP